MSGQYIDTLTEKEAYWIAVLVSRGWKRVDEDRWQKDGHSQTRYDDNHRPYETSFFTLEEAWWESGADRAESV